jgi:hypothetical protein
VRALASRKTAQEPDHRHRGPLRPRNNRPRSSCAAAKQNDEIAPSYA